MMASQPHKSPVKETRGEKAALNYGRNQWGEEEQELYAEFNVAGYELEHIARLYRAINGKYHESAADPLRLLEAVELSQLLLLTVSYIIGKTNYQKLDYKAELLKEETKKWVNYILQERVNSGDLVMDEEWNALRNRVRKFITRLNLLKGRYSFGIPTSYREDILDKIEKELEE